jgi:hypothetical protein
MSIFRGTTNVDYHANKSHLSSSGLKLLLKDTVQFHKEYILGKKENISKPVFDEGSFVHTLILEPEKISEYAIYPGLRKGGKEFEAFKANNPNKIILSASQVLRCEGLYKSYSALPLATEMIQGGFPEFGMDSIVLGVPVKARADYINIDKHYIVDVKTTSMPTMTDLFKETVVQYGYDLSAALYAQIAYDTFGHLFDFYWLVLSKTDNKCCIYKATSATLSKGSALVTQALFKYKQCSESGIWTADAGQQHTFTQEAQYEIEEI